MKVTVEKIDEANILVKGTIENSLIEESVNKLAKQAGKEIKVDGFRKGKVPVAIIKKRLKIDASLYNILRVLSRSLFEKYH